MEFSEWLAKKCNENNVSLHELGELIGIGRSTIYNYSGKHPTCRPRWDILSKICDIFGDDPKDIISQCSMTVQKNNPVTKLGRWIESKCSEFGMTIMDLAEEMSVDSTTISGWIHGRSNPNRWNYDLLYFLFDRKMEERAMNSMYDDKERTSKTPKDIYSIGNIPGLVGNAYVYDLHASLIASGYPMASDVNMESVQCLDKAITRAKKLGNTQIGTGHDNFLCGVRVAFDLTFSNKAWVEAERYHFFDIVSSQSTMHKCEELVVPSVFNEYVDSRIIDILNELRSKAITTHDPEDRLRLLYNIPSGIKLTARVTTNYRQLKTIYQQRKDHRLPEWRQFCKWIGMLPMADMFLMKKEEGK